MLRKFLVERREVEFHPAFIGTIPYACSPRGVAKRDAIS